MPVGAYARQQNVLREGSWREGDKCYTAYSLHLPSSTSLYKEMIRIGLGHKNASPTTYFHLLLEAYLVLITAIYCQSRQEKEVMDNCEIEEKEDLISMLQDSSALLGDYYASCSTEVEWNQAVQYYSSSTLTPDAVLERLPADSPGFIYILSSLLMKPDACILTPSQANCIIDVLENVAPEEVSNLVLKARCMKEFKKKVLNIIKNGLSKTPEPRPTDVIALALIFLEKGALEQVSSVLSLLRSHQVVEVLVQHCHLLFETQKDKLGLTAFSQVLVEQKCDVFIEIFVLLMGEGTISLNAVVDAYMNAFPIVSCGIECNTNSLRLRDLIENFFMQFGNLMDASDQGEKYGTAISVLISLYVASLLGAFSAESKEDKLQSERRASSVTLFGDRHLYLNYFPPFNSKPPSPMTKCKFLAASPSPQKMDEKNDDDETEKDDGRKREESEEDCDVWKEDCNCRLCCVDLLLLQSLLSSDFPSADDRATVLKLVEATPDLKGASSLHVLSLEHSQQVPFILKRQPNALLQYCKDMYESPWQWETVISEVIKTMNDSECEKHHKDLLETVLNEILSDLVMSASFEVLVDILPKCHHDQFRPQIRQCHSAGIAYFLKETFVSYADNVLTQICNDGKG